MKTDDISQVEKIQNSEDAVTSESLTKDLHDHSDKEKDEMADQVVDTIDLTAAKSADTEIKKEATPVLKCLSLQLLNWFKRPVKLS